ncbi:MAG: hypothetical protein H6880_11120 [Rhodobiaceae bacterium]|nr:hypothetical protein [Rhodobiaceae bacterium]
MAMPRRWPLLLAGVFVALAAAAWLLIPREQAASARVLADSGGPLVAVAVSLASARRSALGNADLVSAFVNALPAAVDVIALTNDASVFTVAPGARRGQVRLVELPPARDFTIWPQDPFVVIEGPHSRGLLLSASFERADDDLMARAIGAAMDMPLRRSALAFEGGNIVADERWIYLGANTVRYNALRLGESDREIARRFAAELGGPVLVVGSLPQPVAHIDMMLTPLGEGHLVVADLALGARLARAALASDPAAVARFESTLEDRFDESAGGLRSPAEPAVLPPGLMGATARVARGDRSTEAYLDALAASLRERGFTVSRMPILFAVDAVAGEGGPPPAGAPLTADYRGVLGYPMLTYNNVLVEHRDDEPVVYLPQYGLEALDAAGREAWEALGYRVHAVGGYAASALYGGALRCTAKVLARGHVGSRQAR